MNVFLRLYIHRRVVSYSRSNITYMREESQARCTKNLLLLWCVLFKILGNYCALFVCHMRSCLLEKLDKGGYLFF